MWRTLAHTGLKSPYDLLPVLLEEQRGPGLEGKEVLSSGICVDAGGHVGWTSLQLGKYCKRVVAYEPFTGNYPAFLENTKKY